MKEIKPGPLRDAIEITAGFLRENARFWTQRTSKRLWSLRWPTLTRQGFILAPAPEQSRRRWAGFAEFMKHPAVLLVQGFVLTGVLGSWLTHLHDQRQRESEAVVKSMDAVRAAIDDLASAFNEYHFRSIKLIGFREAGGFIETEISPAKKGLRGCVLEMAGAPMVD